MIRSVAALAMASALSIAAPAMAQQAPAKPSAPAAAPKASAFTPAQREELKTLIHDYIVQNPEVLQEGIAALQIKEDRAKEARQKEAVASNSKELKASPEGTVLGNAKGDVTVVEFFDYNCGYCKRMFPAILDTIKEDGKVRVVMKEFPILGPSSVTAARAAVASVKQGKYIAFHTALMNSKGGLTDESIMKVAADVGLDVKKLEADMKSPEIDKAIEANHKLAQNLNIDGTPAMVVGEEFVSGSIEKDKLKELIAAARKNKKS